jgi:carboxyl-terminal processing protease
MGRKDQLWWVSATVLSLSAFSFFSGLGLRGLYDRLKGGEQSGLLGYPQVASAAPKVPQESLAPQQLFYEVLRKLRLYYVEPLPENTTLSYGLIDTMLNSLNDPNTRFLTKTEVDALRSMGEGVFPGLGAVLTIDRYSGQEGEELAEEGVVPKKGTQAPAQQGVRTITVVAVIDGSPAEKAGLLPGDRITEMDGRWIAPAHVSYRVLTQLTDELGPQDGRPRDPEDAPEKRQEDPARDKFKKEADEARARWKNALELPVILPQLLGGGTGEHEFTIERGRPAKTMKVKIAFGETKADLVTSRKLNANTGLVRILATTDAARTEVEKALKSFQQDGVKNVVLDLRESAGGSLEGARGIAGLLTGATRFAVLKERQGADRKIVNRSLMARGQQVFKPASLSVLVDGGTAGSSELLAAALKEQAGAKLVGSTTFGDGTEQEVIPLDNGAGISITRARMLTSKSVEFEGKGLKPDVPAKGDPIPVVLKAAGEVVPGEGA